MKTLSIKQPWASLIAYGIKDIENRTWKTHFRGKIYIHASGQIFPFFKGKNLSFTPGQWNDINKKVDINDKVEKEKFFLTSSIIGEVEIVDCVQDHPSIWAEKKGPPPNMGSFIYQNEFFNDTVDMLEYNEAVRIYKKSNIWNWVLANAVLYDKPILNIKGKLSFWEYDINLTK